VGTADTSALYATTRRMLLSLDMMAGSIVRGEEKESG
jgi:hypothetical protein